ncbi:hypothetical protein DV737_g3854, partial [Chaetothyriales sp. CBS 132003]
MRPQSEGYANYVDGIGMTMTGQNMAATLETGDQPPQVQALPPNPFGTREEIAAEDWESPLTAMFSRAWGRFRDAEDARHRLEREMEERLLPEIALESPSRSSSLREEIRHIQNLAREMASEISQTQYALSSARQRLSPSPPRVNPIDEQSRPPALTGSDMVVSIACRICNEQRIDTLMEPSIPDDVQMEGVTITGPPLTLALPPSSDPGGDPMQIDDQQPPLCWPVGSSLPSKLGPDTSGTSQSHQAIEPDMYDTSQSHQAIETKGPCGDEYHRLLEHLLMASFRQLHTSGS